MNNGDMPANSVVEQWTDNETCTKHERFYTGLTKRERFAMAAMQGLSASDTDYEKPSHLADDAVMAADALLAALEQE